MDFHDVVRGRRMVRRYQADRTVPAEVVDRLLDLAVRAPSAGFSQGWHFLVLREQASREAFWSATADLPHDSWLSGLSAADVLIIFLSDPQAYLDRYAQPDKGWIDRDMARWPVPYWDVDTGMAALLVLLGATDEQLGACFFGVPADRHEAVHSAFGIPDRLRIVGVVSLGYPRPGPRSPSLGRGRRTAADVRSDEYYGGPVTG